MKLLICIVLSLLATPVLAAGIYRCKGVYTDAPCGPHNRVLLNQNAHSPSADDRAAAITRHYEAKFYLLSREYAEREFQMTKAYLSGTRITQDITTTVIGGGATAHGGGASSGSRSGASSSADARNINGNWHH